MLLLSRSKHKSLFWLYDLSYKGIECRDMCTLVNGVLLGLLLSTALVALSAFALFFVVFVPLMVLYVYITTGTYFICHTTVLSAISVLLFLCSFVGVMLTESSKLNASKEYIKSKLGKYCIPIVEVA